MIDFFSRFPIKSIFLVYSNCTFFFLDTADLDQYGNILTQLRISFYQKEKRDQEIFPGLIAGWKIIIK